MPRYLSEAWMPMHTGWLDAQPDDDFNRRMDALEDRYYGKTPGVDYAKDEARDLAADEAIEAEAQRR